MSLSFYLNNLKVAFLVSLRRQHKHDHLSQHYLIRSVALCIKSLTLFRLMQCNSLFGSIKFVVGGTGMKLTVQEYAGGGNFLACQSLVTLLCSYCKDGHHARSLSQLWVLFICRRNRRVCLSVYKIRTSCSIYS